MAGFQTFLSGRISTFGDRIPEFAVVRFMLDEAVTAPGAAGAASKAEERWPRVLPWAGMAGASVAALALLVLWAPWQAPASPALQRLSVELGADISSLVTVNAGPAAILSPDGQTLVFAGVQNGVARLYIRRLDQLQATAMSGTEGAASPFFSPDGRQVAFFAGGKLKKVAVTGGAPVNLCDVPSGRGGSWAEDDTIVYSPSSNSGTSLMRVSAAGGKPEPLTTLAEGEQTQRWPQVLPGGKAVIYMGHNTVGGTYDDANIVLQPLPAGERKILVRGGYFPRYLPSGHLVYLREGTAFAAPFDLERLEITGSTVPVLDGVTAGGTGGAGAQLTVSANGTLAYLPGGDSGSSAAISWMSRDGNVSALRSGRIEWSNPEFDLTGRLLAIDVQDSSSNNVDVWVYDWARDTLSRLTFDPQIDRRPLWTVDGLRIVFASAATGPYNLYWKRSDGTGDIQRLTDSPNSKRPASWHPNGKVLAFYEINPPTSWDLMMLPMEGSEASGWKPGKPTVFLNTPFNELEPMFSPDGRWVAYFSNETGRNEVYVRPYPGPGGKWQVSADGGTYPTWSRTRRELLFTSLTGQVMVASYAVAGDSFQVVGRPRPWAETPLQARVRDRSYNLHPDGDRLVLAVFPAEQAGTRQDTVVFVFNFFDELRRIAPATRQ